MPRCSIIIPAYNHAWLTRQCVDALLDDRLSGAGTEIVVVDDASTDATRQILAAYEGQIRVATHTTNAGFAAACNHGAAVASGDYLVFLNNDTIPLAGWLDALAGYADSHPDAAVVGSKLLYPNDTIQHAGVVIGQDRYPRHLYASFPADHPAVNKSRRFQIVTAGCALARRAPFEQMGGFDTAFRNGYEDVDLCLRLGLLGYEIHYCHESVLYHLESVSEGRFKNDKGNARLYSSRWAQRVRPDDLHYYLEDGLLQISYRQLYPIQLSVSPLLAVVDRSACEGETDWLLELRARQVADLLKETIRLTMHVGDAYCHAAPRGYPAAKHLFGVSAVGQIARPAARDESSLSDDRNHLRSLLRDAHGQLTRRDDQIAAAIYELQEALAALHAQTQQPRDGAAMPGPHFVASKYLGYQQLVRRIREVVRTIVPGAAHVIVVSKGDDELVKLDGRPAWHFPQTAGGLYSGSYPSDSAAAVDHLEALRAQGGDILLFPNTAFWWLEYYEEFRQHLDACYQRIWSDENCIIYRLAAPEFNHLPVSEPEPA